MNKNIMRYYKIGLFCTKCYDCKETTFYKMILKSKLYTTMITRGGKNDKITTSN